MTLGENIQFYRKKKKYSQEKVAELVGISRQAVTKWEQNQSAPSMENLLKLTEVFEIPLEALVSKESAGEGKMTNIPRKKNRLVLIGLFVLLALFVLSIVIENVILWQLLNTILLICIVGGILYIIYLLIRALNKYIKSN